MRPTRLVVLLSLFGASGVPAWADTFDYSGRYENALGVVDVVRDVTGQYSFSITVASSSGCIGELSGSGFLNGGADEGAGSFRASGGRDVCNLTAYLNNTQSVLMLQEDAGCHDYHGLNCAFTGSYKRTGAGNSSSVSPASSESTDIPAAVAAFRAASFADRSPQQQVNQTDAASSSPDAFRPEPQAVTASQAARSSSDLPPSAIKWLEDHKDNLSAAAADMRGDNPHFPRFVNAMKHVEGRLGFTLGVVAFAGINLVVWLLLRRRPAGRKALAALWRPIHTPDDADCVIEKATLFLLVYPGVSMGFTVISAMSGFQLAKAVFPTILLISIMLVLPAWRIRKRASVWGAMWLTFISIMWIWNGIFSTTNYSLSHVASSISPIEGFLSTLMLWAAHRATEASLFLRKARTLSPVAGTVLGSRSSLPREANPTHAGRQYLSRKTRLVVAIYILWLLALLFTNGFQFEDVFDMSSYDWGRFWLSAILPAVFAAVAFVLYAWVGPSRSAE